MDHKTLQANSLTSVIDRHKKDDSNQRYFNNLANQKIIASKHPSKTNREKSLQSMR